MKRLKGSILIILIFTLLSCRSVQTNGFTPIHVTGAYKHQGSGMIFPENIGKFKRVQITQYAPEEKDIGVGYNLNNPVFPIATTVYIYPAPSIISIGSPPDVIETARAHLFQAHLNAVKREIVAAHPDAKIIADDDFNIIMGEQSHKGRKVTFQFAYNFGNRLQDSISQLYLFQNDTWIIKYRASYPETTAVESEAAVIDFINKLVWPNKGNS